MTSTETDRVPTIYFIDTLSILSSSVSRYLRLLFQVAHDGIMSRKCLNLVELVNYFKPPNEEESNFKRAVTSFRDMVTNNILNVLSSPSYGFKLHQLTEKR